MVSNNSVGSKMLADMQGHLGWLFGLGVVSLLLGAAGLYFKVEITDTVMRCLGGFLLVAGLVQCVDTYRTQSWLRKIWQALAIVVFLAVGGIMLFFPSQSAKLVFMMLGLMLINAGVYRIVIALHLRKHLKLWIAVALSGAAAISLGGMLIAQWPWPAMEVSGTFASVELILLGCTLLYLGLAASVAKKNG